MSLGEINTGLETLIGIDRMEVSCINISIKTENDINSGHQF